MAANGYTEYDSVKAKLRVNDDSLKTEIQIYMHEIDELINNRVRNKIGEYNIYGQRIVLPLAFNTIPEIDLELKGIANDLVVAKIRLQNSEKPLLWDSSVKVLDDYLEKRFGWTSHTPYQPIRTLTVSPTSGLAGATVTIGGTKWQPITKLRVRFDNQEVVTTPTALITNSTGTFSGATFTVPLTSIEGTSEIIVNDDFGGIKTKFQVTV